MKSKKNIQNHSDKEVRKKYSFCDFCSSRLKLKKNNKKSKEKCFICKNIFEQTDYTITKILSALTSYEFSNFELGTTLKPSLIDRDDHIRSKFQVKGGDSIKTKINNVMSKKIARKTNTEIKHIDSDLTIKVNFKDETYEILSKPIFIYGRYIKKSRIITQKQKNCSNCFGKGCHACDFHGVKDFDSVEGQITQFLIKKFDCKQVRTNWVGGEEKSTRVLGNGRPFFAKIINPKKRKRILRTKNNLEGVQLQEFRKINSQPKGQIFFKSRIEAIIRTDDNIKEKILKQLQIMQMPLQIHINGKKTVEKKIYKMNFRKISPRLLKINMYVDGGISIKSLIHDSNVVPNLAYLLKTNCECVQFDFKKIDVVS